MAALITSDFEIPAEVSTGIFRKSTERFYSGAVVWGKTAEIWKTAGVDFNRPTKS